MRPGAKQSPGRRTASGRLEQVIRDFPLPSDSFRFAFPPVSQDALRSALGPPANSPRLGALMGDLELLDSEHRGWVDAAVGLLAAGPSSEDRACRSACVMLSLRPVTRPGPLLESLAEVTGDDYEASALLLALLMTDTTETMALERSLLERFCQRPGAAERGGAATFLCFLKCLQHRLLDQGLFKRALECGAMSSQHDNGRRARAPFFHPVLDYLGLTGSAYFREMYQQAIEAMVFEPSLEGWESIRRVRRFCGERYLLAAAERLDSVPGDVAAMHIARRAHDFRESRRSLGLRMSRLRPATLMLLSIIRRDLDAAVAAALQEPDHGRAMRLLRQGPFRLFEAAAGDDSLRCWCVKWHPELERALAAFGRLSAQQNAADSFDFARREIAPDLRRLLDNLAFVWALSGTSWELLAERAGIGSLAGLLALGLVEDHLEEAAAMLARALDHGTLPQRRAAAKALERACRRLGVSSERLRASLQVDAAWQDSGLEGALSRVWPDLEGWTVKLTVARGKPEVVAYGPKGPAARLPREVRGHAKFEEVMQAKRELAQQQAHLRGLLEQAMNSQRPFSPEEFQALCANGMFRDMAGRLVLESGSQRALGSEIVGQVRAPVRVVHAAQLMREGALSSWQGRIMREHVVQPFKQCFREVYVCEPEEAGRSECLRFDGRRVIARRAFALLRARGWAPCAGCAVKYWPMQGVRARFVWAHGVDRVGLYLVGRRQREPVSLGAVRFSRLSSDDSEESLHPLALGDVAEIVFSESLRDADLVAARAGCGDVGLGSRETMALRAAIVRLLARELKLWHVAVSGDDTYALVQSGEGDFKVHLGTGSVFTEPEGRHVPVLAGVRTRDGELTLPFEVPDLETARIVAIILGLARAPQAAP